MIKETHFELLEVVKKKTSHLLKQLVELVHAFDQRQ